MRARVLGAAAAGIAVLVVLVLFGVGLQTGREGADAAARGGADSGAAGSPASATPSAGATSTSPQSTPAPTDTGAGQDAAGQPVDTAPPGPLAPGVHAWNALHGGECLTAYSSPWEEEFTVVDCAEPHTAQLVTIGVFTEDPAAPWPGEAELASRLNLLCTAPTVLDPTASGALPDVQWQASYPATDAQWAAGDRRFSCFFSRSSGEPLGATLVPVA